MKNDSFVFKQFLEVISKSDFEAIVKKHRGDHKFQDFDCWLLFQCLCFGQLTNRDSLRDLVICLKAHNSKLYHMGFSHNHIFNGGHLEEKTGTKAKYLRNAPLFVHFSF